MLDEKTDLQQRLVEALYGPGIRTSDSVEELADALIAVAKASWLRTPSGAEPVAWPGRKFCEAAERDVAELAKWIKGEDDKQVASDAALAIRTLLASPLSSSQVTEERDAAFDKAMGLIGVDMSYLRTVGAGNTYTSEQVLSWLHSIRQSIMRAKLRAANPEMGAEDLTDAVAAALSPVKGDGQ